MTKAWSLVSLLLAACSTASPPALAIRGVTVVDVASGSLLPDRTVVVSGHRISAVGPANDVRVPPGAEVVEGVGGFLIPGLWDAHVHSVASVAWDMDVGSKSNAEWHFPLFLAHGITSVRNMNDATADPTLALTRSIKRRLAEGALAGPRLLANGPTVDGDPPLASNPVVVRTPEEARSVVDALADHGADFVKVYSNLSRDAYVAIMERARQRSIPVDGHPPFRVLPAEAAEAGQRTFEHLLAMALGCSTAADEERRQFSGILSDPDHRAVVERAPLELFRHERRLYETRDEAACLETIEAYRKHGVAEAPSLVGYHHVVRGKEILSDTKSMRLVPPPVLDNWKERIDSEIGRMVGSILEPIVPLQAGNTRLLHEGGVMLLAATDVGIPTLVPGLSLHEELALLVDAGLTPLEALRTATVNPARTFGMADSLGTIEPGKLADLVLLDADPLADIAHTRRIRAVVADGRLYRRSDLDRLLGD